MILAHETLQTDKILERVIIIYRIDYLHHHYTPERDKRRVI